MKRSASASKSYPVRRYPTIGVCGLDCGLCPRYYTRGKSRCPGCGGPDFLSKRPTCSFITCCVRKRNLEVCAECSDFPCSRFKSENEYQRLKEISSYPSYKVVLSNLNFIKEHGIRKFAGQQRKRITLLERMIDSFDDGRSRSFFCRAACLCEVGDLEDAVHGAVRAVRTENIDRHNRKGRAKILREYLLQGSNALRGHVSPET